MAADGTVFRYVVLSGLHSLYAYFIEGDTIFVGKRKTYAKRVESERIRVDAKSNPPKHSSILSGKATTASAPSYQMSMSYVRLTNSGKTVIHKVSHFKPQIEAALTFMLPGKRACRVFICRLFRQRGPYGRPQV